MQPPLLSLLLGYSLPPSCGRPLCMVPPLQYAIVEAETHLIDLLRKDEKEAPHYRRGAASSGRGWRAEPDIIALGQNAVVREQVKQLRPHDREFAKIANP